MERRCHDGGRIAEPAADDSGTATAAAPLLGSWLLDSLGASAALALMAAVAVLNAALVLPLMPSTLRR